jgi:hypothetical protein
MHSHYAQEATSYANMQLSVHERIDDLWRRAHGLAPSVAESAAGSGCTDKAGTYRAAHKALGPRQRMAWDMIAEAHGWNAISDSPAMLAEAERRESAGEPYYVGYENTKPAEFTTALATETNVFEFGVWGHDQPLELLPADDARETAEVNALVDELSAKYGLSTEPAELHYHDELRHYSDGDSIAVIPCTERHVAAVVTLTLSDQAAGCPVHGAGPCRCDDLLSEEEEPAGVFDCTDGTNPWAEPAAAMPLVGLDTPEAKSAMRAQVDAGTYTAGYDAGYAVGESGARPAVGPHERSYAWHRGYADALLDAEQSQTDTELVSCEECSAPCDGTLTAWSELFGKDVPVCPDCYRMCTLATPAEIDAELSGPATDCELQAEHLSHGTCSGRHAGELWDIPTSYTGRHRCSVI